MKNKVCGPNITKKQPGCHCPENFRKICWRQSLLDWEITGTGLGVAEQLTCLEDKYKDAMAENAWLQAEMKKIYKANTQRELLDGQMVDNMAVQIALPSGWMVSPDFS